MTQWIANLFSTARPKKDEPQVTQVFFGQDLRLDVQEVSTPCGHVAYFVKLYWYSPIARNWIDIATVSQDYLGDAIELLQTARSFIDAL